MRIGSALAALALGLVASQAGAVDNKAVAKCAALTGDLDRLECYDRLAESNNLKGPAVTPGRGAGKWEVQTQINPVDDSKTVVIYLEADSGRGKWGKPIGFIARCKSDTTEVYINWRDYLGLDYAKVLTRIGTTKASTSSWSISTDRKASFHPKPIQLLKSMMESDKFIAQVTPYGDSPITAVFDTTGLKHVAAPLRMECGW